LATELAAWSGGRVGWAISVLADPAAQAARREQLAELIALAEQDLSTGLRWAEQRAKEYRTGEQETALAWLELWQSWWRDVVYVASGCDEAVTNVDRRAELAAAARRVTPAAALAFLQQIIAAAQQLRENVNPQLALEHLVLHLPRAK
ncbi:DNA polymerase III subunit delta' C-terminal domain-containing protein, partial [Chloroflexus sp.]|uniref:DNA polymerase III subunit delta' C-terminal domain-containing protein n=1 Tax=Chloroflexus sp. TaxID=1904827 RepID=UPI002ACE7F1D